MDLKSFTSLRIMSLSASETLNASKRVFLSTGLSFAMLTQLNQALCNPKDFFNFKKGWFKPTKSCKMISIVIFHWKKTTTFVYYSSVSIHVVSKYWQYQKLIMFRLSCLYTLTGHNFSTAVLSTVPCKSYNVYYQSWVLVDVDWKWILSFL